MNELQAIAEQFLETLKVDQTQADKDATAALMELAEGSEEAYLGMRTKLAGIIHAALEADMRAAVAEANIEDSGVEEDDGVVTEDSEDVIDAE